MYSRVTTALLAGVVCLSAAPQQAAANDVISQYPGEVIYAERAPDRSAGRRDIYQARSGMGGGFIEFLFNDDPQKSERYIAPPSQERRSSYGRQTYIEPSYDARPGALSEGDQAIERRPRISSEPARPDFDPRYEKQVVNYSGRESAGTIVVDTPNKFLFLVNGDGTALRYGIGVGRPGFTWSGVKQVTAKKEWPGWTPPKEMLARRPDLPRHMIGGPDNPLGARALYLGSSLYRIHGSNEPWTIGTNVSSGCIRMRNEDVIDLYGRVGVGARVVVI